MRITGTNIDSMDLTGVLIDGGAAIDIVGNLIEGNAGPAIIVSAGMWGAPMGVTIESNYCTSSDLQSGCNSSDILDHSCTNETDLLSPTYILCMSEYLHAHPCRFTYLLTFIQTRPTTSTPFIFVPSRAIARQP